VSTIERNDRQFWLPLVGVFAVAVIVFAVGTSEPDALRAVPAPLAAGEPAPAAPAALPQARWAAHTFVAGARGPLTKAAKRAIDRQRVPAEAAVLRVVDALVLDAPALAAMAGEELAPSAAKALAASRLQPPRAMTNVQTVKRVAAVGIEASSASRGAAKVAVWLKGELDGKKVRLAIRATLWLERRGAAWQIVAFDGTRERYR